MTHPQFMLVHPLILHVHKSRPIILRPIIYNYNSRSYTSTWTALKIGHFREFS